jgi:hypothetical protein
MKKLKNIYIILFSVAITFFGCQANDYEFGEILAPSNISINVEVMGADAENPNGDGSGLVTFTATANNSSSYIYYFNDIPEIAPSGILIKRFVKVGLNSYQVVVKANGNGGLSSTKTLDVEVFSSFSDIEAESFLSGAPISKDSDGNDIIDIDAPVSKRWYVDSAQNGALGVGPSLAFDIQINNGVPSQYYFPAFFAAPAGSANDCFTDDELIFTKNVDGSLSYVLDNKGQTFFNGNPAHQVVVGGSGANGDECFDFDTSAQSTVSLSPTSEDWSQVTDPDFNPRETVLNFTDGGFMGYYVGSTSFEILEISETEMHVRTLDTANSDLVWYLKFTSEQPSDGTLNSAFTDLVWEDDFNTDGAPNPANWTYDLGAGGWGNGELQTYTKNAENVIVEDGFLKIMAKANGASYTSARLKSEGLREYTYGRYEIRAKLPASQGTWPAIWTLGANFSTVSWPASGEMDILEQRGDDKNTVFSTIHYPGNFAGDGPTKTTELTTSTTEFHKYTIEWSAAEIKFAIDDQVYHTLPNDSSLPFNADFFFIFNVAMGGTLGGTVDPDFTEDMMEIDYIKVYQ